MDGQTYGRQMMLWLTHLISIRYQKMGDLQPLWVERYSSVKFIRVYHIWLTSDHMWPERCVTKNVFEAKKVQVEPDRTPSVQGQASRTRQLRTAFWIKCFTVVSIGAAWEKAQEREATQSCAQLWWWYDQLFQHVYQLCPLHVYFGNYLQCGTEDLLFFYIHIVFRLFEEPRQGFSVSCVAPPCRVWMDRHPVKVIFRERGRLWTRVTRPVTGPVTWHSKTSMWPVNRDLPLQGNGAFGNHRLSLFRERPQLGRRIWQSRLSLNLDSLLCNLLLQLYTMDLDCGCHVTTILDSLPTLEKNLAAICNCSAKDISNLVIPQDHLTVKRSPPKQHSFPISVHCIAHRQCPQQFLHQKMRGGRKERWSSAML